MSTIDPIEKFRSSFHRSPTLHHFNNAGVAPISIQAKEAVAHWANRFFEEGIHSVTDAMAETETTRNRLASLLGSSPDEIGFFQSAASAISQVAFGLELGPDDEVVVWDQEYPSNFHPWRLACERSGAKLVVVNSGAEFSAPLEELEKVLTKRTKIIAFSWVQYRTGAIVDLENLTALARSKNILTCSDIIQGAGLLPFDFAKSGLDFACGGSHKWFVSPLSTGYLITKKSLLESLSPLLVGAMTFGGPDSLPTDVEMNPTAARFEPGSRGILELVGFGASLKLIEEVGIARISQEVEWLSKRLMHGLREIGYVIHSPHGAHFRGSIVNFTPSQTSSARTNDEIAERLSKQHVSFGRRPPGIRLAPHAFNSQEEVERLLSILS
ncbi:MAG: aminotransferase class V-fold PLP-dependent enzyme [Bdellovibrionota bacterium]